MRQIIALTKARTKEYYRDKGSLFWSFFATPLIVITLALAFSSDEAAILRAGLIGFEDHSTPPFHDEKTIELIHYQDLEAALSRVEHHQLDILVKEGREGEEPQYWVNPESQKSQLMEKLLSLAYAGDPNPPSKKLVSGTRIRYVDWVIPGILAMNMMFSGLWGIGYVIVRYRKNGVLKRLKATPISAWEFLAAQGLSRLAIMLTVTTIVYFCCNLLLNFMMEGSLGLLVLIAIAGNLAIISISLLLACRTASEELANGLLNLISFPMLLLSEMWFSLDSAPQWLIGISQLLPLTHLVAAARAVMLEGAGFAAVSHHLAILLATALVCLIIASRLFRWDKDS